MMSSCWPAFVSTQTKTTARKRKLMDHRAVSLFQKEIKKKNKPAFLLVVCSYGHVLRFFLRRLCSGGEFQFTRRPRMPIRAGARLEEDDTALLLSVERDTASEWVDAGALPQNFQSRPRRSRRARARPAGWPSARSSGKEYSTTTPLAKPPGTPRRDTSARRATMVHRLGRWKLQQLQQGRVGAPTNPSPGRPGMGAATEKFWQPGESGLAQDGRHVPVLAGDRSM
jgi:hypothetical protein